MRKIMDEFINSFLEDFGSPEIQTFPTQEYIESYRGRLPDALLGYWRDLGFSRYKGGLFWIVDPEKYQNLLSNWIENTPLSE